MSTKPFTDENIVQRFVSKQSSEGDVGGRIVDIRLAKS